MKYAIGAQKTRRSVLLKELKRIKKLLIKLGVRKILLFGSIMTGRIGKSSDIDLLIVKDTKKRFLDRLDEVYKQTLPRVSTDMIVYTTAEYNKLKSTSVFCRRVLKEGKVIYEA